MKYIIAILCSSVIGFAAVKDAIDRGGRDIKGGLTLSGATATTVPYLNSSKVMTSSSVTPTELGYLSGVTSAIQTQLNGISGAAPPTFQNFTVTGTQTGWLFTVTAWVGTVAVGDTYTNNSNTYTVQIAQTNGTGQTLFMSGTGATSGGTLTKAVSASGPATITFSAKLSTALYTLPASVRYIHIKMVGGGGGGSNSGTAAGSTSGGSGGPTVFGKGFAGGGDGGVWQSAGAAGGTPTLGTNWVGVAILGTSGQGYSDQNTLNAGYFSGGIGGSSPYFSGGGASGVGNAAGGAGITNTGGGGQGGGNAANAADFTGVGGGSGGFIDAIVSGADLYATFPYAVGTAGAASTGPTNGFVGGAGAAGQIIVEEHY